MTVFTAMDELKRNRIMELLEEGKRIDGRAFDEYRPISIETGRHTKGGRLGPGEAGRLGGRLRDKDTA